MNVNSSVAGRNYPEQFHPEALYEFKVDTDGDAVEDITFRVSFGHSESGGRQGITLSRLDGAAARDRKAEGAVLARGHTEEDIQGASGLRVWAGKAGEPFYIEATVLGAIRKAIANGQPVDLTAWNRNKAVNAFANTSVSSIVIEVPDKAFSCSTIGFWGVTALATDAGGWRQINRAGLPMIQPIFNPDDSERSSAYNTTEPKDDGVIYGPIIGKLVAGVVGAMKTSADPQRYGQTVAELCFPDILRYKLGTPTVFGFALRNGRALSDNAPEVMFSIVTNAALSDGLDAHTATGALRPEFPYVARPVAAA